ncbi:flagellar export chaperone FlgN [Natronospora cellulosivora (SeqCode)]
MNPDKDIESLINYMRKKTSFLEEVLDLTKEEYIAVKKEDLDKVEKLLGERKTILLEIDKLDKKFIEKFEALKTNYGVEEISQIKGDKNLLIDLQEKTKYIKELLERIKDTEDELKKDFTKQIDEVKQNLLKVNKGKKATSNYHKEPIRTGGTFLDKKN